MATATDPRFDVGDVLLYQGEFVLIEHVTTADDEYSGIDGNGYIIRFNDQRPAMQIAEAMVSCGISSPRTNRVVVHSRTHAAADKGWQSELVEVGL